MKKLFLFLLALNSCACIFAQDSTSLKSVASSKIVDTANTAAKWKYRLYNYTSPTINNVFSENIRDSASNRIDLDFDFYANSNGVPAALAYDLLFNYFISDALINRADNLLGKMLKFDESLKTGATYKHHFNSWDGNLIIGYNFRQMLNVSGPKQSFETAFYGNARFEGDTANLSNINLQYYNYNQYSIGISKKIDYGKYQMEFGVLGSFLQAINNLDIQTGPNTWLYTAPYGEYIDLNYNLTYNSALSGAPEFLGNTGFGASGDLHLGFMNKDKWKLTLDINDFGVMSFRKTPENYSGSNYVNFQGIAIPNLANFSAQTFDTLNVDSAVKSKLPPKTNNAYSVFLPFEAQIIFSKPLYNDRLVLNVGAQYRNLPDYYIYGFVKLNYFMKHDMVISATAAAGGYSLFNLGFEFSKTWKFLDFTIGSANLIGMAVPTYYPGSSLYFRIASSF